MISTAKADLSATAESADAFAEKFGLEIETAVLGILCTFLIIYVIIATIALLIKVAHAALGFGFCGALSMLFDFIFCIIHGVILYSLVTSDSPALAIKYLVILFAISLFTLFSNGASLSKPAGAQ